MSDNVIEPGENMAEDLEYGPLTDDELTVLAAESFRRLDQEEAEMEMEQRSASSQARNHQPSTINPQP